MDRSSQIIRTSWIGIIANVLLAAFKAGVGLLASSVAIVMDAVNNLSDALSSVITIIGTKLSQRPADRKHPFGFGRIEYFSAIIIAVIVLTAGVTSLIESVKKIFNPTEPNYTTTTLIVIIVAIVVKLVLGRYVKSQGEKLKSDALIASGSDALFDAIITLATLISAGVMLLWDVSPASWEPSSRWSSSRPVSRCLLRPSTSCSAPRFRLSCSRKSRRRSTTLTACMACLTSLSTIMVLTCKSAPCTST